MGVLTFLGKLPGADAVEATLNTMVAIARRDRLHPTVRELAENIIVDVAEYDDRGEAAAVHGWVRDRIRYTRDAFATDTLRQPLDLIENPFGDCDDMSLLTAALLAALGHDVRFAAVAFTPDGYSHVFTEVLLGSEWVASDATQCVELGWRPADALFPPLVRRV